jgi:hypothetical protein
VKWVEILNKRDMAITDTPANYAVRTFDWVAGYTTLFLKRILLLDMRLPLLNRRMISFSTFFQKIFGENKQVVVSLRLILRKVSDFKK